MEGIEMEKDPNEKMFLSVLEHHYRTDALFKEQF